MHSDREEAAISDSPELVAETMAHATERLRENAWMIAPMTSASVDAAGPLMRRRSRRPRGQTAGRS